MAPVCCAAHLCSVSTYGIIPLRAHGETGYVRLGARIQGSVSAVASRFCECYLMDDGTADSRLCFVLDLASAPLYPGVHSVRQRLKDAEAACEQIFNLWDTIKEA